MKKRQFLCRIYSEKRRQLPFDNGPIIGNYNKQRQTELLIPAWNNIIGKTLDSADCLLRDKKKQAITEGLITSGRPVSYTHLDVYKRQVCNYQDVVRK